MRAAAAIAAALTPALTLTLTLTLLPGTARAQAYQCRVPQGPVSTPTIARDGPVRRVPITGYTFALSWSPEYCRARRGAADDRQCAGRDGRFGFVVHGLWPEGQGARWPQWCPTARVPTSAELARMMCLTPSAQLLTRAWTKHGACMASRPDRYFGMIRTLWSGLRWPDFDRLSRRDDLTAGEIREAFAQANRLWEQENIGLVINERGWLQELRLCYDKAFRPARCGAQRAGPADSVPVRIWRGL